MLHRRKGNLPVLVCSADGQAWRVILRHKVHLPHKGFLRARYPPRAPLLYAKH